VEDWLHLIGQLNVSKHFRNLRSLITASVLQHPDLSSMAEFGDALEQEGEDKLRHSIA